MIADFGKETIKSKNIRILSGKKWPIYNSIPSKNILHNEDRNKCISRESNMLYGDFPPYSGLNLLEINNYRSQAR